MSQNHISVGITFPSPQAGNGLKGATFGKKFLRVYVSVPSGGEWSQSPWLNLSMHKGQSSTCFRPLWRGMVSKSGGLINICWNFRVSVPSSGEWSQRRTKNFGLFNGRPVSVPSSGEWSQSLVFIKYLKLS